MNPEQSEVTGKPPNERHATRNVRVEHRPRGWLYTAIAVALLAVIAATGWTNSALKNRTLSLRVADLEAGVKAERLEKDNTILSKTRLEGQFRECRVARQELVNRLPRFGAQKPRVRAPSPKQVPAKKRCKKGC